jgi:hypothetical protein
MSVSPGTEILERLDEVIGYLERDENRFYVEIDLAHQLRDHFAQSIDLADSIDE